MQCDALIRDIPIFEGYLEDGVNVYKAKDIDEFEKKIKKILTKELPSVAEKSYEVAKERDIKAVGKKLKEVYEELERKWLISLWRNYRWVVLKSIILKKK